MYSSEKSMQVFITMFIVCIIVAIVFNFPALGFLSLPIAFFTMYLNDLIGDNQIE